MHHVNAKGHSTGKANKRGDDMRMFLAFLTVEFFIQREYLYAWIYIQKIVFILMSKAYEEKYILTWSIVYSL